MRLIYLILGMFITTLSSGQQRLNEAIRLFSEGKDFYERKDYESYMAKSIEAHDLLPFSRSIKYNLAASYALNNEFEKSFAIIEELIRVDTRIPFDADSVFSELKKTPEYPTFIGKVQRINQVVTASEIAFELDQIDLHPESIAYHENSGLYYISSMRKRKIVTYDPKTSETLDWITTKDLYDLYGVMGMKLSSDGNSLWFCSSPLPQMEGYQEDGQYTPSVFKVSLGDKSKFERFSLPVGSVPGDLVVAPDGTCYVTDSAVPRIFIIEDNHAKVFFDGDQQLVNLQGISLKDDYLFIADYLLGVHRLNISTKTLLPINISTPNNTAGVDGLYYHNNSLITIQNGVYPFRIGQYFLNDDLNVTGFKYYDKGGDHLDEPTLGLIRGDELYFIANSPWGYYDGNNILLEYLQKPQIRKIRISE